MSHKILIQKKNKTKKNKKQKRISKTHSPKEPISLNNITRDWLREAKTSFTS
jgi:hypothetical protein